MTQTLLNFSANERLDLPAILTLAQTQPIALAAQDAGTFQSRASTTSEMWILHGFAVTANVQVNSNSPAVNQLSVSPGSGLLAWRQGGAAPTFGVLAALDGTDQQPQGLDLSVNPSGAYSVWVRLNYAKAGLADRTFWNAASPGFEYSALTPSQLRATWEVQALGAASSPGAEWLKVASLTWQAPTTQGGSGAISNLTDLRPLYFEGTASSSTPFAPLWGSGNDRSAARGTYGVSDLRTMLDALRACLEDIKGPGLRRWWDPGIGGINVGFGPNAPVASRLAVGDANFYLQGRTSSAQTDAYLVVNKGGTAYDGLHFSTTSLNARWMQQTGYPLLTLGRYGTAGFGPLSDVSLAVLPGRSLVEMITSTTGQTALRLGARALNGALPVSIDTSLNMVGADQTGNNAQVLFSTGGVQGPETLLYRLGKGVDNAFYLTDVVAGGQAMRYSYVDRSLSFNVTVFTVRDAVNNVAALNYTPTTRVTSITSKLSVGDDLTGAGAITATGQVQGGTLKALSSVSAVSISTATLSATGSINAQSYQINNTPVITNTAVTVPSIGALQAEANGSLVYSNNQLYARINGAWKVVQVA